MTILGKLVNPKHVNVIGKITPTLVASKASMSALNNNLHKEEVYDC